MHSGSYSVPVISVAPQSLEGSKYFKVQLLFKFHSHISVEVCTDSSS